MEVIGCVRTGIAVIVAGLCLESGAPASAMSVSESATHEKELTGLIVSLAAEALADPNAVARQLGVILRKAGSGETGWIDYETSGASNSAFFRTMTYRQYVVDGRGPVASKVLTHVALDLAIRYELCFTGDELVERYFSGSLDEFAKAQPMEPSGTVFPLQINGTEVSIRYQRSSKCVAEVSLSRISPAP